MLFNDFKLKLNEEKCLQRLQLEYGNEARSRVIILSIPILPARMGVLPIFVERIFKFAINCDQKINQIIWKGHRSVC